MLGFHPIWRHDLRWNLGVKARRNLPLGVACKIYRQGDRDRQLAIANLKCFII